MQALKGYCKPKPAPTTQTQTSPVSRNFTYVTDAFGRRIERIVNGEEKRRYVYDSQGRLVAEINLQGKVKFQYVYATKSHSPDFIMQNNIRYKLIHDHLGSVRLVINAQTGEVKSRIDYDEFGKVEPKPFGVGFQSIGFAGGIYDPTTRLTRFGARDYDADVMRWTSKDPMLVMSCPYCQKELTIFSNGIAPHLRIVDCVDCQKTYLLVDQIKKETQVLSVAQYRRLSKPGNLQWIKNYWQIGGEDNSPLRAGDRLGLLQEDESWDFCITTTSKLFYRNT